MPTAILAKPTSHPNLFRKRIRHLQGSPAVGDWVRVFHDTDTTDEPQVHGAPQAPQLFAYGLYNPKSEIAVRLMRWSTDLPDEPFWDQLLDRAVSLRTQTLQLDAVSTGYRVVHAEADGFPGLAIDRYADCLSAEVFSIAMAPRVEQILEKLAPRLGTRHWLIQPGPHLQSQEGFKFPSRASAQLPSRVAIEEFGTKYEVHFDSGHKTGFFCDQRDNRHQLGRLCRGKSVLDVCCYTGGFSVMAAAQGASEVTGVDLDAAPLEIAKRNARINGAQAKFTQADAFAYMRDMLRGQRQFDIVVLDPPKLIRNRGEIDEGTRKHFDLNRLAMQLVKPGGLMLTCSCAGLLPASEFARLVKAAGRSAFRPSEFNPHAQPRAMQILAQAGAAACHPVSANCPETEYFKSLWLRL